jgi:hypothetical protein
MNNAIFSQLFPGDLLVFNPNVEVWRNDLALFSKGDIFFLIFVSSSVNNF